MMIFLKLIVDIVYSSKLGPFPYVTCVLGKYTYTSLRLHIVSGYIRIPRKESHLFYVDFVSMGKGEDSLGH